MQYPGPPGDVEHRLAPVTRTPGLTWCCYLRRVLLSSAPGSVTCHCQLSPAVGGQMDGGTGPTGGGAGRGRGTWQWPPPGGLRAVQPALGAPLIPAFSAQNGEDQGGGGWKSKQEMGPNSPKFMGKDRCLESQARAPHHIAQFRAVERAFTHIFLIRNT